MNRSKVVLTILLCLVAAVTLTVIFLVSNVSPSNTYHVGDVVTEHWKFVGYLLSGSYTSNGLSFSELANFDNTQTGGVVSFDVSTSSNPIITLGNRTYVCTSYFAPSNWYGNDPSTITLEVEKK